MNTFKFENRAGPMLVLSAIVLAGFAGLLIMLSTIQAPTIRQREALQAAHTAQAVEVTRETERRAVEVTREAARHAVTKEAVEAVARELEATRYVTWADVSPMLTRQAVLSNDLEAQFHIANRALIAVQQTPTAAPVAAQVRSNWIPWLLLTGTVAALGIREWGKTQRARMTVTVRTPFMPRDGEIEL